MLTKEETLQFKGNAILIMIFLHLFNKESNVALCEVNLFFLAKPLVFQLSKFAGICVWLYVFLSGYGLYISYQKKTYANPWKRILKLYINFWIVFVLFIPLACYLRPDHYPGTIWDLIKNITGWHPTYNGEWWFLFPYVLLVLTSNPIFRITKSCTLPKFVLLISGVYILSSLIFYFFRETLEVNRCLFIFVIYFSFLYSFLLGVFFAKFDLFKILKEKIKIESLSTNILCSFFLIIILLLPTFITKSFFSVINLILFICLFSILKKPKWFRFFMEKLEHQSTNMWLVHSFFLLLSFS